MSKNLKKLLKKVFVSDLHEQLAVGDAKLGGVIKEKLNISCVHSAAVVELMRGIRQQMDTLISGLPASDRNVMALGLAHRYYIYQGTAVGIKLDFLFSLSRYKLKFSPDKVDTMVIQAICK